MQPVPLRCQHPSALVDRQLPGQGVQQPQGVELALPVAPQGLLHREGEAGFPGQPDRQTRPLLGGGLLLQGAAGGQGIEIGGQLLPGAVQPPAADELAEGLHRLLAGPGVLNGGLRPQPLLQPAVAVSVLAGHLGGGIPGLAGANPVRLQHHRAHPRLLQQGGGENAGHAAANDGGLRRQVLLQRRPGGRSGGLMPN